MNEKTEMLHELCRNLTKELDDVTQKISRANGMSAGDLETVDKLSHALKSVKTTIAMIEADDGYSNRYMPRSGSYHDDRNGMSYARGRMYARRDSMGRYSRGDGYSYAESMEDLISDMEGMLPELSGEKRRKVQKLIDELQS